MRERSKRITVATVSAVEAVSSVWMKWVSMLWSCPGSRDIKLFTSWLSCLFALLTRHSAKATCHEEGKTPEQRMYFPVDEVTVSVIEETGNSVFIDRDN